MKRFGERSILLTVLLALLLALPAMANAATSGTCGDNLTWTLDDESLSTGPTSKHESGACEAIRGRCWFARAAGRLQCALLYRNLAR